MPFYRRALRLQKISEAHNYPGLDAAMYLTACHLPSEIDRVYRSQPWLRPSKDDLMLLDPASFDLWDQGLPVTSQPPTLA